MVLRVDADELDLCDDGLILLYDVKPFTGVAFENDAGGVLIDEAEYVDGSCRGPRASGRIPACRAAAVPLPRNAMRRIVSKRLLGNQRADRLPLIDERCVITALQTHRAGFAQQRSLGATDACHIEQHADMTGEPEAPGVRDALAIADDQIRGEMQLVQGLRDRWQLTEREEPRDVVASGAAWPAAP